MAQKKASKEQWLPLFNGKNLNEWDVKIAGHELNDNYGNTFRVEDGILKISYDQYETFAGKFGHIYYKQPFSYYKIRFEYRFVGNQIPGGSKGNIRNSGIMIHSQSAKSLGKYQDFPVSLEVQFLGGLDSGDRPTGNLCTPGTQVEMSGKIVDKHCISSNSKTYHGDQWVAMEAIVLGDSLISHVIAGDTVLKYEKTKIGGGFVSANYDWKRANVKNAEEWIKMDGTSLKEGYIALQAESHPIEFRKLDLLNLVGCTNPRCSKYKSYYIKRGECSCQKKKKKKR